LFKLAFVKLVFYKQEYDKSALGMLILLKFMPEKEGRYKLRAVIAAAALFYIDLFFLD
jgi:hypothetical protein